jgi:hypothetical protein
MHVMESWLANRSLFMKEIIFNIFQRILHQNKIYTVAYIVAYPSGNFPGSPRKFPWPTHSRCVKDTATQNAYSFHRNLLSSKKLKSFGEIMTTSRVVERQLKRVVTFFRPLFFIFFLCEYVFFRCGWVSREIERGVKGVPLGRTCPALDATLLGRSPASAATVYKERDRLAAP